MEMSSLPVALSLLILSSTSPMSYAVMTDSCCNGAASSGPGTCLLWGAFRYPIRVSALGNTAPSSVPLQYSVEQYSNHSLMFSVSLVAHSVLVSSLNIIGIAVFAFLS